MLILKTRSQKLGRLAFDPSGHGLAAGGQRGVYWWRSAFDGGKPVCLAGGECGGLGFTPDGTRLISVIGTNQLAVFDLGTGRDRRVRLTQLMPTVAVCPATGLAVTESWGGGEMVGWRVAADGEPVQAWATPVAPGSIGSAVAFAADGSWFVRAAQDLAAWKKYQLVIHDPATGKAIRECRGDDWVSSGPAVSPDKRWIAFGCGRTLIRQPVERNGEREAMENDNTHQYTGLAFHSSGQLLAITNNDRTVRAIDTATWQPRHTYTWDVGRMRSVAFTPDGAVAAAGSDTGKVVLWDVEV